MGWRWIAPTAAALCLTAAVAHGGEATSRFTAKGEMTFPADYRTWVFLSSGHGMSYNSVANAAASAPFDNVFVEPHAYAEFVKTGHWPVGTVLVLEIRGSSEKGSINQHGAFQSGKPLGIEVHVRDDRFTGGWGFFDFPDEKPAALIPYTANCYSCHQAHAAVDTTFVQFYPTLLPVAQAHDSFSAAWRAETPHP